MSEMAWGHSVPKGTVLQGRIPGAGLIFSLYFRMYSFATFPFLIWGPAFYCEPPVFRFTGVGEHQGSLLMLHCSSNIPVQVQTDEHT